VKRPLRTAWLLALLAPAGCDHVPPLVDPPPVGITVRVDHGDREAASARAHAYCARFGKSASQQSVTHDAGTTLVAYSCK
jgi:hypothetical protein